LEIEEIIREKFPLIVDEKNYNGSRVVLFKRDSVYKQKHYFETINDYEKPYAVWDQNQGMIDSAIAFSGKYSCSLDEKKIYSPGYTLDYKDFPCQDSCILNISVNAFMPENATAEIVFTVEKPGRENEWSGSRIQYILHARQKWGKAFLTRIVGTNYEPNDKMKIYIWNTGKEKIYIDDFCIQIDPIRKK
jgi:hypothetical protein